MKSGEYVTKIWVLIRKSRQHIMRLRAFILKGEQMSWEF